MKLSPSERTALADLFLAVAILGLTFPLGSERFYKELRETPLGYLFFFTLLAVWGVFVGVVYFRILPKGRYQGEIWSEMPKEQSRLSKLIYGLFYFSLAVLFFVIVDCLINPKTRFETLIEIAVLFVLFLFIRIGYFLARGKRE